MRVKSSLANATTCQRFILSDLANGTHQAAPDRREPLLPCFCHVGVSLLCESGAVLLTVALEVSALATCVAALAFLAWVVLAGAAILDVLKVTAGVNVDGLVAADDWAHIRPA